MKKWQSRFLGALCAVVGYGLSLTAANVTPSVEVFLADYADEYAGKKIGLITNPTGVDSQLVATADLFHADPRFHLTALFGPEHGIRGNAEAGKKVENQVDAATGVPIYSLYSGNGKGPAPEALANIDVLVYHIQDIGARSYTYVWTMAQCMVAAKEADKPFVVLDVPNPILAAGADGAGRDEDVKSFIGLYPVPYVYGLTAGELALYLNKVEGIDCDLTVVPMQGYKRSMSWAETGLPWIPTSPNIPSVEAAVCYPITGQLGELGAVNIGVNWTLPFQVVGAPYLDADKMAAALNARGFGGIIFRPIHYKPAASVFAGQEVHGVQLHVTDVAELRPVEVGYAIMDYVFRQPEFQWPEERLDMFAKATGSRASQPRFARHEEIGTMIGEWQDYLETFNNTSANFHLYED